MILLQLGRLVLSCVGFGNFPFLNASIQGLTVFIPIVHCNHPDPVFGCDVDIRRLVVVDQVLPQPLPYPMVAILGIIGSPCYNPSPLLDSHPFGEYAEIFRFDCP